MLCGGTAHDRAVRLFAVRDLREVPKELRAKGGAGVGGAGSNKKLRTD